MKLPAFWRVAIFPAILFLFTLIYAGWWIYYLIIIPDIHSIPKGRILKEEILFSLFFSGLAVLATFSFTLAWIMKNLKKNLNYLNPKIISTTSRNLSSPTKYKEFNSISNSMKNIFREWHDKKNVYEQLIEEKDTILSGMSEGFIVMDIEGNLLDLNSAAGTIFDLNFDESRGRNIKELVLHLDFQEFVTELLEGKDHLEYDLILHSEQKMLYLQVRGIKLISKLRNNNGFLIFINDVSRVQELEAIRRDFVANVSHELKTPITAVKGAVETLQQGAVNDPDLAKKFLDITSRNADRLNEIINDLLTLSRLEQDKSDPFRLGVGTLKFKIQPIKPVILKTLQSCEDKAQNKRITMTEDCPPNAIAKINSPLLEQALVNLVINAIKYSDTGSSLSIKVELDENELRIIIRDEGHGIAQKHIERLFERFYRVDNARSRKMGGTGLGLSIVKHIVQVHGGQITVKSKLGKGSSFILQMPRIL
jgi:two-component system phosphate regulon sensor histidine kinase PhoR